MRWIFIELFLDMLVVLKLEHVFQIAVHIANKSMQYIVCLDATGGKRIAELIPGHEATEEVIGLVGSLGMMACASSTYHPLKANSLRF